MGSRPVTTKKTTKAKTKKVKQLPTSMVWDILWRNYLKALKANKLDQAERVKKMIDSFDQTWLKLPKRATKYPL